MVYLCLQTTWPPLSWASLRFAFHTVGFIIKKLDAEE